MIKRLVKALGISYTSPRSPFFVIRENLDLARGTCKKKSVESLGGGRVKYAGNLSWMIKAVKSLKETTTHRFELVPVNS